MIDTIRIRLYGVLSEKKKEIESISNNLNYSYKIYYLNKNLKNV